LSFVKIHRLRGSALPLPRYESDGAAGMDLRADLEGKSLTIKPLKRHLLPCGIALEIPVGYEMQIRPRSGLALKHGITLVNAPGTIDSDYRGEIGVLLINLGDSDFTVHDGDRIAQMVLAPVSRCRWVEDSNLEESNRGQCGFGSTGK